MPISAGNQPTVLTEVTASTASIFNTGTMIVAIGTGSIVIAATASQGSSGSDPWKVEVENVVTVTASSASPVYVQVTGAMPVVQSGSTSGTIAIVFGQTGSVTLMAANVARRGLSVFNSGTQPLYMGPFAAAGTSSFSVIVQANGYFENPFDYTGVWTGNWPAVGSTASVIEFT